MMRVAQAAKVLQGTSIGADASTNTNTGQVHVAFGYDRQTNTLIPKTKTA